MFPSPQAQLRLEPCARGGREWMGGRTVRMCAQNVPEFSCGLEDDTLDGRVEKGVQGVGSCSSGGAPHTYGSPERSTWAVQLLLHDLASWACKHYCLCLTGLSTVTDNVDHSISGWCSPIVEVRRKKQWCAATLLVMYYNREGGLGPCCCSGGWGRKGWRGREGVQRDEDGGRFSVGVTKLNVEQPFPPDVFMQKKICARQVVIWSQFQVKCISRAVTMSKFRGWTGLRFE